MASRLVDRLAAWLALAATVLAGVAPAQGFVLCLEPDGCVSLERALVPGECDACVEHADEERGAPAPVAPLEADASECACIDLRVPSTDDEQRAPGGSVELHAARTIAWRSASVPPPLSSALRTPRPEPRPPAALALLHTVVLLV